LLEAPRIIFSKREFGMPARTAYAERFGRGIACLPVGRGVSTLLEAPRTLFSKAKIHVYFTLLFMSIMKKLSVKTCHLLRDRRILKYSSLLTVFTYDRSHKQRKMNESYLDLLVSLD